MVVEETGIVEVVNGLRKIGRKISEREIEFLRRIDALEAERRLVMGDPPCCVCGTWSDDWLCPKCRDRFPWMYPKFGGW